MTLKTLIADDEPLALQRLRTMLALEPSVAVVAECRSGREALEKLQAQPIDLALLDIQMPGMEAFELIERVGVARMPLTIFVTGHSEFALRAFDVRAVDYLVKPIRPERLRLALAHARERLASRGAPDFPRHLVVPGGARQTLIQVEAVEWIGAADYYAELHVGAKTYLLRQSMKELTRLLDPRKFVRIHRSAIVNLRSVREINHRSQGEGFVVLSSGERVRLSTRGWKALLTASQT
jgi:two-component system LytT family response regulator